MAIIAPVGLPSTEAFGNNHIAQVIQPSGLANALNAHTVEDTWSELNTAGYAWDDLANTCWGAIGRVPPIFIVPLGPVRPVGLASTAAFGTNTMMNMPAFLDITIAVEERSTVLAMQERTTTLATQERSTVLAIQERTTTLEVINDVS